MRILGQPCELQVNADADALGGELKVASFVVELTGSHKGAAADAAAAAAPLTWRSGETRSAESSLQLPRSLVQVRNFSLLLLYFNRNAWVNLYITPLAASGSPRARASAGGSGCGTR